MNIEPANPRPLTKVEAYVEEVLPKNSRTLLTLPAGIDPERFKNSLQIALMMQPKLLSCEPRLVFREVSRVANHGLSLDPSLGEAWLILRKKDGITEPQAQIGYRGKLRLARQSGEVARIAAYPVTERCMAEGRFRVTLQSLVYEPDPFNDDSPPIGYFAYVLYRDGSEDFECMSIREIHKIRDRSDGWRAFKGNKIRSTPWSEFEGEMCKKTVLSRLLKRIPMSANVVEFLREDEAADFSEVAAEDITPPARKPSQSRVDALRAIAGQAPQVIKPPRESRKKTYEATAVDEPETEAEQEAPESPDVIQDPVDELPADEPAPDEPQGVDRKSKDYQRGREDHAAGLKRCLNAEIRAEAPRFENWKAGWLEARDEFEEAANGREDA